MVSTLTGSEVTEVGAEYWVEHVKSTVRFMDGMKVLESLGVETYVEVGSDPTLVKMGKRCVSGSQWLPSLEKGKSDTACVEAASVAVSSAPGPLPLVYNRQAFPWREAPHPLLGRTERHADGSTTFVAPIRGKLVERVGAQWGVSQMFEMK